MAGIITNFKNDIQRLQDVKKAIADVKNELKSIDIKVDIDTAKGLELRLKSLTTQYDALVRKIGEAEGEMMLSTKKINDASRKIIQTQEDLSKSTGGIVQPRNQGIVSRNVAETTSIQAQAKAYDELRDEIDKVVGIRSQNIKRMIEETNAIRLINAEIKEITKSQGASVSLSLAQQKRLEQLNNSLLNHKTALSEVREALNNNVKLDNAAVISINGLAESLSRMRITYRELTEEERNSPFGKELLASINQADMKIKELDATIRNHQRDVGDYGKQWNGLSMSIQQIGRELPSLASGPKMFFSAILNNLPILADKIKHARNEYDLLKQSGQAATPVWKQVASSLFSWQTALTVGITLLTMYGDKIVDWVVYLFSAKKALSETYQNTQEFQKKVGDTSGPIIATLEKLSTGWKQLGNDINAQKKYILDNKDAIDSMGVSVTNVAEAERLFNTNKDAFIQGIIQRAKAAATMELASEEYKKSIQKILEADAKAKEGVTFLDKVKSFFAKTASTEDLSGSLLNADLSSEAFAKEKEKNLRKESEDHSKSGAQLIKKYIQLSEEEQKILKSINIKSIKTIIDGSIEAIEAAIALKREALKNVTNKKDYAKIEAEIKAEQDKLDIITGQKGEKFRQQQQRFADDLLFLRRKNQQDEINLMKEGSEKKIAQINIDYQKEIAEIKKLAKEWASKQGGSLTVEQTVQISTALSNAKKTKDSTFAATTNQQIEAAEAAMRDYLIKYGTYKQQQKNIADEYAARIAKAEKEALTPKEAEFRTKKLQKEMEDMLSSINLSEFKENSNWDSILGNLNLYSAEKLKELRNQLRELIETDKSLSVADKTDLIEQYNKFGDAIIRDQNALGKVFGYKTEQQNQVQLLKEEYELRKKIYDNLVKEQSVLATRHLSDKINLEEFFKNKGINSDTSSINFNQISSMLSDRGDANGLEQFKSLFSLFNKSGSELSNVTAKVGEAGKSMQGASSALQGAGSSAAGTIAIIDKIIHGINDNVQSANELLHILEVEDTKFGKGFDSFAKSSQYATQAWESLKSGNIMGVAAGVAGSIKELGNAVGSWFGLSADYSKYNKMKEEYDSLIDVWDTLISKKQEYIDIDYGDEARKAGKEVLDVLNKKLQSNVSLGVELLNSGASFGSRSIGVRQRKGMSSQGWNELSKAAQSIGFDYNSVADGRMTGLFNLSAEQLSKLQDEAPTFWAKLDNDVRGYLQQIIDCNNEIEDMKEKLNETMTGVSFESFYDSFISTLSDMDKSSKDMADDFGEYLKTAILSNLIANKYRTEIEELYNDWANKSDSNGDGVFDLNPEESAQLKAEQQSLAERMIAERDAMAKVFGWDSASTETQTATQRGYDTMSQDTASELNGRFTALQMAGEEIKAQNIQQTETMNILSLKADSLLYVGTDIRNIADETRSILANSYLELRQISDNTGAIITPINEMNDKLEKIQRNTENL